jgi:hypothetical protein
MPAESSNLNNPNPAHFQTRKEFAHYYEISVQTLRKRLKRANINLPTGKISLTDAAIILAHQGTM